MDVNIKFCEPAYAWTTFIAEFLNSASSLAYLFPGIYYFFQIKRFRIAFPKQFGTNACSRYLLCCGSWILVAFASGTFHATQSFWGELFDECAMVLASWSTCISLRGMYPSTKGFPGVCFYMVYTAGVFIGMSAYLSRGSFPIFEITFILSILTSVILVAINQKHKVGQRTINSLSAFRDAEIAPRGIDTMSASNSALLGAILSLLGYTIWHVDRICVHNAWEPPLTYEYSLQWHYWAHPLWHAFTASGVFFFMHATITDRIVMCAESVENREENMDESIKKRRHSS